MLDLLLNSSLGSSGDLECCPSLQSPHKSMVFSCPTIISFESFDLSHDLVVLDSLASTLWRIHDLNLRGPNVKGPRFLDKNIAQSCRQISVYSQRHFFEHLVGLFSSSKSCCAYVNGYRHLSKQSDECDWEHLSSVCRKRYVAEL